MTDKKYGDKDIENLFQQAADLSVAFKKLQEFSASQNEVIKVQKERIEKLTSTLNKLKITGTWDQAAMIDNALGIVPTKKETSLDLMADPKVKDLLKDGKIEIMSNPRFGK